MSRAADVNKIAYNMNEAARALGVSRAQVYRMIKRGDLRKFTWAGRSLIKADVLHAAIDRAAEHQAA